jgi:putative DNA primase/helicase
VITFEQCTLDDVAKALDYLDAGCSRNDWIVVGAAIKNEFGEGGRDAFQSWSEGSDKYDKANFLSSWKSIKATGRSGTVTIATLFKLSIAEGYKSAKKEWSADEKKKREVEYAERRAQREKEAIAEQVKLDALQNAISVAANTVWDHLALKGKSDYLENKNIKPNGVRFISKQFMFVVDLVKNTAYVLADRAEMNAVVKLKKQDDNAISFLWLKRGSIALPMYDMQGKLWSLQFVSPSGTKLFIKCSKKSGTCFLLSTGSQIEAPAPIMLAEGFATGASILMATGYPVFVCWDAGNLLAMSSEIRKAYSDAKLLICGDNDSNTKNNPGLTKSIKAAAAANCDYVVPTFESLMSEIKEAANG